MILDADDRAEQPTEEIDFLIQRVDALPNRFNIRQRKIFRQVVVHGTSSGRVDDPMESCLTQTCQIE